MSNRNIRLWHLADTPEVFDAQQTLETTYLTLLLGMVNRHASCPLLVRSGHRLVRHTYLLLTQSGHRVSGELRQL